MLILYYSTVAIIIKDSQRICEKKLQKVSIHNKNIMKSEYGA
jgi:hypothetical protein